MARVVTQLRCSSEPAARHTAATEGRPRARATDLAQSAVHFAHIGTFSAIFSEVDCNLGHPGRQHPHRQQGRDTHSRDPTIASFRSHPSGGTSHSLAFSQTIRHCG